MGVGRAGRAAEVTKKLRHCFSCCEPMSALNQLQGEKYGQQGKGMGQLTLPENREGFPEGPVPLLEGEEGGRGHVGEWGRLHGGQGEPGMLGSCRSWVLLAQGQRPGE